MAHPITLPRPILTSSRATSAQKRRTPSAVSSVTEASLQVHAEHLVRLVLMLARFTPRPPPTAASA